MITGINFGGLHTPPPKTKPKLAPLPLEYKKPTKVVIKNVEPKRIDD